METTRDPSAFEEHHYSVQAVAIASALAEGECAHIYRAQTREWLDRLETISHPPSCDIENGLLFAEFLTKLCRVGAGLETDFGREALKGS